MGLTHQDIAEYMDMKVAFNIGYDVDDVRKVLATGGFEHYSYHFLSYMLLVLYNGAKVGRKPTYIGEIDLRIDKIQLLRDIRQGLDYKTRREEFSKAYIPKLAKEVARLTLTNTSDAQKESSLRKQQLNMVIDQFGSDGTMELKGEITEMFLDIYYKELEGKIGNEHLKIIDNVVSRWETLYFKSYVPGYVRQIERYKGVVKPNNE